MSIVRRKTLRGFRDHGWARMPLLDPALCRSIREQFEQHVKPFDGPLLRQLTSVPEVHHLSVDGYMTNPIVNPHLRHELGPFATIERQVMEGSSLVAAVEQLLGAPPAMLQSTYYESSRGTHPHLDFNPVVRERPMLGVWIALEDIGPDAGRFFLYPDSHTLPRDARMERFAELAWANYRQAFVDLDPDTAEAEAQQMLAAILDEHPRQRLAPALKAGDAVFWSSDLLHGSEVPQPGGGSRSSLLFHFIEASLIDQHGLTVH